MRLGKNVDADLPLLCNSLGHLPCSLKHFFSPAAPGIFANPLFHQIDHGSKGPEVPLSLTFTCVPFSFFCKPNSRNLHTDPFK